MSSIKVDLVVSGAGPVGLFFAYQMATRGHSVFCLDPKQGPTDQSRALLVTSRTMEILENKGIASGILEDAFISSGSRMYREGAIVGSLDALGDTNFPQLTISMQGTTETVLYNRLLQDTECKINWETELVSYTQEADRVVSVVRDISSKQEQTVESRYIVGADGSHSRVRKGMSDWTYEGVAIATKFALADLTIRGDRIDEMMERMNVFMQGSRLMGMVRINPMRKTEDDQHVFRIFGNMEEYKLSNEEKDKINHGVDRSKEAPPTLEFVQEWMDKMASPFKFEASNLIWSSWFRINERMANGFRRQRAFVMGDAAHCHSPAGGQGMNLGLQDADNLAWKLSNVLKGQAVDPEKLLDSYSAEREPHARNTIKATSQATAEVFSNRMFVAIRTALITTAMMVPQIKQYIFKNMMQLAVAIDPNNPSSIVGSSDKGLIPAGQFLPDTGTLRRSLALQSKSRRIERSSLHELLVDNHQLVAIFVGTCFAGTKPNTDLIQRFWVKTRKYASAVRPLVIQSAWHSHSMRELPSFVTEEDTVLAERAFYTEDRIDLSISVTSRVGLYPMLNSIFAGSKPPSVVLLVRPDLYVAQAKLVSNEEELDLSLEYLDTLFATA